MNLNKLYTEHGIKWGLIQFLVIGGLFFAMYFTNLEFAVGTGMWITLPISIGLLVIQGLQARKFDGSALTYGNAFKTLFFAALVSVTLFSLGNHVVKAYIAPDLAEEEKIISIRETAERMEDWGVDEERIDETIEKMEAQSAIPTIGRTLVRLVFGLFFNVIIILIVSIFVKKKKKETEVIVEQETT